ncbi:hypothetical protein F5X68DRAFT_210244 [Plectosphaerella plurivora]|uniref:SnoaL-like domain-containing protein n=1 Tax=Plectosphaerella plurivora TaxID=936078 RepID=A0A9P8V998_9PEZI|nr:hypothetical protein F5X68DRAFT_210244 [Plectosphaerella plurivora]
MAKPLNLPFGTKSLRSTADIENYLDNLSNDRPLQFTPYYSPNATFKWSGNPDRTTTEFVTWVEQVHTVVDEKLMLQKAIFNAEGTKIAAVINIQFRGKENVRIDNFGERFGPVWPGHGPLVRAYVWYNLDKDGHILEAVEDIIPIQIATLPENAIPSSL